MSMSIAPIFAADEPLAAEANPDVFEGPEKKLEVFFSSPATADGLRAYGESVWSDVCSAARCTILHVQPYAAFDAYLLSESSLFVYPSRVIMKTCGTTTLLLALPKLLELASSLELTLQHVHYSHFRYKFPSMQVYPHLSFATEQRCLGSLLEGHVGAVHAKVIGAHDATRWYALCTEGLASVAVEEPPRKKLLTSTAGAVGAPSHGAALPAECDDLFEVAMEGMPAAVCDLFFGSHAAHAGASGRRLAESMTRVSGIGELLSGVHIDDWAFEPCGYSMNGSRGVYYYTIHITPEFDFSYASFETNDPAFRDPERVAAVLDVFQPSTLTATLTTRRSTAELPAYELAHYDCVSHDVTPLSPHVTVCCLSYSAVALAQAVAPPTVASVVAKAGVPKGSLAKGSESVDGTGSEASSDDTCELPSELMSPSSSELTITAF